MGTEQKTDIFVGFFYSVSFIHQHGIFRTCSGLFRSWPEKIIAYIWGDYMCMWWGDHMMPVLYKVRGNHQIVHVGGPYIHVGDYMIPVPYKVRGDHQIPIPYKVWRDHKSHWELQCSHSGLLIMKTLHIDSYKVLAVDSNHIVHVGGDGMSLPLRIGHFKDSFCFFVDSPKSTVSSTFSFGNSDANTVNTSSSTASLAGTLLFSFSVSRSTSSSTTTQSSVFGGAAASNGTGSSGFSFGSSSTGMKPFSFATGGMGAASVPSDNDSQQCAGIITYHYHGSGLAFKSSLCGVLTPQLLKANF